MNLFKQASIVISKFVIILLTVAVLFFACSSDSDNNPNSSPFNNSPTLILGPKPESTNYDYDSYGRLDCIWDENGDMYVDYKWAGQMLQGYEQYIKFQNIGQDGMVELGITLYESDNIIKDTSVEYSINAGEIYFLIVEGEAKDRSYNPRNQISISSPNAIATDSTASTWSRSSLVLYRTIDSIFLE